MVGNRLVQRMDPTLRVAQMRLPLLPLLALSGCLFTADRVDPVQSDSLQATSAAAFFQLFQQAYQTQSTGLLSLLLAPDYVFQADPAYLADPTNSTWGRSEELARHLRMFQAISNVSLQVQYDPPTPTDVPAESTWHVSNLNMTMDIQDTSYEVYGQADFLLRAVPQPDSSRRYVLVRWTDRN